MGEGLLVIAADVFVGGEYACLRVPVGFGCGKRNKKVCDVVWEEGVTTATYLLRYVSVCRHCLG